MRVTFYLCSVMETHENIFLHILYMLSYLQGAKIDIVEYLLTATTAARRILTGAITIIPDHADL